MNKNTHAKMDWMMWQIDNSQIKDPPFQNLVRAIQYYTEKYGHVPNCCEVALDWEPDLIAPEGMLLTRSKSTQPGTILLAQNTSLISPLPGINTKK